MKSLRLTNKFSAKPQITSRQTCGSGADAGGFYPESAQSEPSRKPPQRQSLSSLGLRSGYETCDETFRRATMPTIEEEANTNEKEQPI